MKAFWKRFGLSAIVAVLLILFCVTAGAQNMPEDAPAAKTGPAVSAVLVTRLPEDPERIKPAALSAAIYTPEHPEIRLAGIAGWCFVAVGALGVAIAMALDNRRIRKRGNALYRSRVKTMRTQGLYRSVSMTGPRRR